MLAEKPILMCLIFLCTAAVVAIVVIKFTQKDSTTTTIITPTDVIKPVTTLENQESYEDEFS